MKIWPSSLVLLCLSAVLIHAQSTPDIYSQLAVIDNASPGAPVFKTMDTTEPAIVKCAKENLRTEFDTTDSLLRTKTVFTPHTVLPLHPAALFRI
jgi:hypothetical protein